MERFWLQDDGDDLSNLGFLDANGRSVKLGAYRGRVVLLTVWATWCGVCEIEMPTLNALQSMLGREGLTILPVSIDSGGPSVVRRYIAMRHLQLPALSDPQSSLVSALRTQGVPYSVLIGPDGREIGRYRGRANWISKEGLGLLRSFLRGPQLAKLSSPVQ